MKKLTFSIQINASRQKVWEVLWNEDSYTEWTSVFGEGGSVDTDWKEGSKIAFLSATGDGMSSRIAKKIPNQYMSFLHVAEIKDGVEQPLNEESKKWSGATENYTLSDLKDGTKLDVDMDITDDHEAFFREKFPGALEKVKELAEAG